MVGRLPDPERAAADRLRRGGPRDRAGGPVRAGARGLGAREAARAAGRARCRRWTWRRRRRRWPRCASRCAVAAWRPCTTSPRAAWPWRSRSAASRAAWARAIRTDVGRDASALFGEGPGGVVVAGPRDGGRGGARRARDRRGGRRRLEIDGAAVGAGRGAARARTRAPSRPPSGDAGQRPPSLVRSERSGSPAAGSTPGARRPPPHDSSGTRRPRRTSRRVRRLRRLRAGVGRRPARVLRPVRAPAPRPGVGRHRHRRERPHHDRARPRPRVPGLRRGEAARAPGRRWRSATCATPRPARRRGRTPSPSGARTAARSPSRTTAT